MAGKGKKRATPIVTHTTSRESSQTQHDREIAGRVVEIPTDDEDDGVGFVEPISNEPGRELRLESQPAAEPMAGGVQPSQRRLDEGTSVEIDALRRRVQEKEEYVALLRQMAELNAEEDTLKQPKMSELVVATPMLTPTPVQPTLP